MTSRPLVRNVLVYLTGFMALCAFGGGTYGFMGAAGVPVEWLAGSPFPDYFIPSLILFWVVGGSALFASVSLFAEAVWARNAVLFASFVQLVWISVQVLLIGFVSWLQPAVAAYAMLTFSLALFLPRD